MQTILPSRARPWALFTLLLFFAACDATPIARSLNDASVRAGRAALDYPRARRGKVADDYHGTRVADPYRWLEEVDAPETRDWVEAENALFASYMAEVPERESIAQRLSDLWNHERYGVPVRKGARTFFTRNDGLQDQSVLYVVDRDGADPRVLLDPNTLSEDGTVALSGVSYSPDGRWLAYGLAEAGSDWNTWRVRDVERGEDLPEVLEWIKFSRPAWTRDGSGFFYSRYDAPEAGRELADVNRDQKLWFHARGSDPSEDMMVYARPDQPEWSFRPQVTEDGRYLVLHVSHGTDPKGRIFYAALPSSEALAAGQPLEVVALIAEAEAMVRFVGNDGDRFWIRTDRSAPRGRLVRVELADPRPEAWLELIPESEEALQDVSAVGGRFVVTSLRDARSAVRVHDLQGRLEREVELPGTGSVRGFSGELSDATTFFSYTSFTTPGEIWRFEVATGRTEAYKRPELDFDPNLYTTEQVFFESKDGTRVPMFLSYRKGLRRDASNRTLLYGYGGFNISLTPSFSVTRLAWMELGGIFAQANLRGGGEYGEAWHRAGTLHEKQNVFDDFIAAAEFLIQEGWTTPRSLAIQGGSNGGLLVGACMTQRPDLYGAALPAVGVMDMLRYQLFTIGWAWTSDYGSSEDPEQFASLYAYSPYHNLRPGTCYPPTLVTTADHDDRVVPGHSFKFAAALQHAQGCANPALIRIETRAGHGSGKPTSMRIEEAADQLAFLVNELSYSPRP